MAPANRAILPRALAIVLAAICLLLPAANARADDEATRQEIEQLKQRIEQLEEKQRQADSSDSGEASDLAAKISLGGVLSGVYQYEWVSGPSDPGDQGRGAISFQPEVSYAPTEKDEIFFLFGFAAGNGLNGVTAFNLDPWAAVLEDDVKNINGRNRDYLLTAWYMHRFDFGDEHRLALTGGLIDATDYLDENAYSNDEYTQFLNVALVNAPNAILPSFDIGGALEWDYRWSHFSGVYMNVGENDDGNNYSFYGIQWMFTLDSSLGKGHYRVDYNFTNQAFLDPTGTALVRRETLTFSFDQAIGSRFGAWIRFTFRDDSAAVDYDSLLSGGVNISGTWWGREADSIGIGYAYVNGAEQAPDSIRWSQVAEAYVNFQLNAYLLLTFDLQYLEDRYVPSASDDNVKGWVAGVRATAEF